jgi:lipoprotein-anchoring transpeptidase ErfK/SrfK
MRNLVFAAGMLAALALAASPASAAEAVDEANGFSLVVDVSDRKLYVMQDGEVQREFRVAVGQRSHPTPRGSYRVSRVIWNPRWVPPDAEWAKGKKAREPGDPRNPMGRVKIFFRAPDYYIHGTHEEDSLGRAESRGCIRMRNADVIALARLVMENGGERRPPGWFQRVSNRVRQTEDVRLSRPIPLRVRD